MIGGSHSLAPVKSSIGESHTMAGPMSPESRVAARGRTLLTPDIRAGATESDRARNSGGIGTEGRGGSVVGRRGGVDGAWSVAIEIVGVLSVVSDVSDSDLQEELERSSQHTPMDFRAGASPDSRESAGEADLSASVRLSSERARAGSGVNDGADAESGDDGALDWSATTLSSEQAVAGDPESAILSARRAEQSVAREHRPKNYERGSTEEGDLTVGWRT